ncbi:hypothetical protein [Acetobacterium sp. KB-1]|jgi:hypothetical protein|uniref:hypothetical protein n=1 Tax=Acetobacterium sp. KB-1 TaxID=2184575 RepID=UPI000DBEC5BB|nr:hypothetical protein [Acetobacterium sp. KB-1]AWW26881.1 hypothetical protein DOZ58_09730 [Acetobacterium sp. KB-1]
MFKSLSLQKNKLMMLVLATLLTLAMVVLPGMNVVKAATPVTVKVSFCEDGVPIDSSLEDMSVTVDDTAAVLAPLPANYPNSGTPTAFDATISAYYDAMGSQSLDGMTYGYDSVGTGYYVNEFFYTPMSEVESYYSGTPGQSYWHGYSWVLYINGSESNLYASNVVLDDDDTIVWDYKYVETTW